MMCALVGREANARGDATGHRAARTSTRIGMIVASGATPVTPSRLFVD